MTDDELLAELSAPPSRYTVEHDGENDLSRRVWFVRGPDGGVWRSLPTDNAHLGRGFDGKRRTIAIARALNELEG